MHGFFTTHRYPPWLKFRQRQRIFVQFPTAARFKHLLTPTRDVLKFRQVTSDSPPPPRQSLSTKSQVITHDNFAFRKGLIVSGLMHNSPAKAMLACLNPWICFYPPSPLLPTCAKKIEHVILFYLFNRIVLCLEHIILWFDIKRNILYKSKFHYFTLNWCFLFVCLLDCSLNFLIDWLIDWLIG